MSYKIGGAQNNSAPFDLNLDLQEVFSRKTTPQKGPILVLISPILLLIGPILLLIGGGAEAPPGPFLRCAYEYAICYICKSAIYWKLSKSRFSWAGALYKQLV